MVFYSNGKNNNFIDIQACNMKLKNRPLLCKHYRKIPQEKSEYLIIETKGGHIEKKLKFLYNHLKTRFLKFILKYRP